jgi:hypothetical protein
MAAAFSFSNRRVSPAAVKALETITASVDVTNTGDVAGSVDVHMTGWWVLTRSAYPSWLPDQLPPTPVIQPGATETVTFAFFPSVAMGAVDDCPVILEGVLAGYVDVVTDTPAKATLTVHTQNDSGAWVVANVNIGSLSGATPGGAWVQELDPGTYLVSFGGLAGYETPAAQSVTLASGEAKAVTGVYTLIEEEATVLRVSLQGADEAEVYLDEESSRIVSSGTPLEIPISAGFHHVEFGDLEDYVTPAPVNFTAAAGQTYLMTITYVPIGQANNTGKMLLAGAGLLGLVMLIKSDKVDKRRR